MKNFSNNTKYLIFALTFVITGFAFSHQASAATYAITCLDGEMITSTVNISPTGPFSANNPTTFIASAQIRSTCSSRFINLTASNNNGLDAELISNTYLGPSPLPFPSTPAITTFTSPSSVGSYAVRFVTTAEESLPTLGFPIDIQRNCATQVTVYSAYEPAISRDVEPGMDLWLDPEMQNPVPSILWGYAQSIVDSNNVYELVTGHYTDSNGVNSVMAGGIISPC